MDAKTFTDLLKAPKVITGEQLKDLDEIIKANPYCKSASLLYLAGLHQHDNKKYTERLSQFILFGKDKRMLHWIIDSLNEEIKPEAKVKETPEKEPAKQAIKIPVKEPEKEARKEVEKEELSNSAKLKAVVDKRLSEINKNKSQEEKKPEKAPEKTSAKGQGPAAPTNEEKHGKGKLIDKFIEEEPSISKPEGDYKHNIDLANKSSRDSSSITSETLAQIHLNQGNKKRAIEIYEKLILTNPEKSSYFAALIEKINKKSK